MTGHQVGPPGRATRSGHQVGPPVARLIYVLTLMFSGTGKKNGLCTNYRVYLQDERDSLNLKQKISSTLKKQLW